MAQPAEMGPLKGNVSKALYSIYTKISKEHTRAVQLKERTYTQGEKPQKPADRLKRVGKRSNLWSSVCGTVPMWLVLYFRQTVEIT